MRAKRERQKEKGKNEEKWKKGENALSPLDVLDVVDLGGARVGRVDADDLFFFNGRFFVCDKILVLSARKKQRRRKKK